MADKAALLTKRAEENRFVTLHLYSKILHKDVKI